MVGEYRGIVFSKEFLEARVIQNIREIVAPAIRAPAIRGSAAHVAQDQGAIPTGGEVLGGQFDDLVELRQSVMELLRMAKALGQERPQVDILRVGAQGTSGQASLAAGRLVALGSSHQVQAQ